MWHRVMRRPTRPENGSIAFCRSVSPSKPSCCLPSGWVGSPINNPDCATRGTIVALTHVRNASMLKGQQEASAPARHRPMVFFTKCVALATTTTVVLLALAAGALEPAPAPVADTNVDRTSGAYFYTRYCAGCHGRDGRGTLTGFPLVDRPSGPVTSELVLESLRTPLQLMPSFPRDVISDDVATLIAHH